MRLRGIFLLSVIGLLGSAVSASGLEIAPVVEVARACPQYGPGFIQVPGSRTCIRIGGRVRAEVDVGSRRVGRDRFAGERIGGFGTSARVRVDSRTETDYGPLRLIYQMDVGDGVRQRR